MGLSDISEMIWDYCDVEEIEGLERYSILYRKNKRDGTYEYTVVDTAQHSQSVLLDGIMDTSADPLQDVYDVQFKLDPARRNVVALFVGGTCLLKRL